MQNLRIAPLDEEDDLYSGYNDYPSAFNTKDLEKDELFQQALKSSYGKRLGVVSKLNGIVFVKINFNY